MTHYDVATSVVSKLQLAGYVAYFVGGWVRDFLMGHPSDDIDIVTSASAQAVQELFPKTIPIGVQFGIVIVVENNHHFEVATFRSEEGYGDGRRPSTIKEASAQEDAQRRDFTINGMFYDPIAKKLFDFVGGREDLEKKTIRAIGDPKERFKEDKLRMIRAARYACRLHFTIEDETKKAITQQVSSLFPSVAIERVWQEFTKMKKFGNFRIFLTMLYDLKLLPIILEEITSYPYPFFLNIVKTLDVFPQDAPVISKVLSLFPDYDVSQQIKICEKFKLSNEEKQFVLYQNLVKEAIASEAMEKADLAHLYAKGPFLLCLKILTAGLESEKRQFLLHRHEKSIEKLSKEIWRIKEKKPVLSSEFLKSCGILPGKKMGQLLKEGEKLAINHHLHEPEKVVEWLKKENKW